MKAITIHPPYPNLICLPKSDPRYKPVENRSHNRFADFRGLLLIHSGSSTNWLSVSSNATCDARYDLPISEMKFGYLFAVCLVVEFFGVVDGFIPKRILDRWPELATNPHVEGRYCMVLEDVRKFPEPIKYRGQQGLFEVPDSVVAEQLKAVGL